MPTSSDQVVGGPGKEVDKLIRRCDLLEDRARRAEHTPRLARRQLGQLFVRDLAYELPGDRPPVFELRAVVQPLPDLRTRYLRGSDVLHEVVDSGGPRPVQPGLEVLDADANVGAQARLGDVARRGGEVDQVRGADVDVGTLLA